MSTRDITLRWDDTNIIEKGYKVYRSNTSMNIDNMPEPIATLEPNTTEYIDSDQTIGDTNYYRIGAYIDGYEEFSDEFSIEVTFIAVYGVTQTRLYAIDVNSSNVFWDVPMPYTPSSVGHDKNGNILVGFENGTARKYDKTGELLMDLTIGVNSKIWSICELNNGSIVMGANNGRIYRLDTDTSSIYSFGSRSGNYIFGLAAHKNENMYYVTSRNDGGAVEAYDNNDTSLFYKKYASPTQNGLGIDTSFNEDLVVHTTSGYGMHLHESKTGDRLWGYNPSIMRDAHSVKFRKSDSSILSNDSQSGGGSPHLLMITSDTTVVLDSTLYVEPGFYKVGFDIYGHIYNVHDDSIVKRNDNDEIIWRKSLSGLIMVLTVQPW